MENKIYPLLAEKVLFWSDTQPRDLFDLSTVHSNSSGPIPTIIDVYDNIHDATIALNDKCCKVELFPDSDTNLCMGELFYIAEFDETPGGCIPTGNYWYAQLASNT